MDSDCGDVYPDELKRERLQQCAEAYKEGNNELAGKFYIEAKLAGLSKHYGVQKVEEEAQLQKLLSSKRIDVGKKCICGIGSTYEGFENLRCINASMRGGRSIRHIYLFQVGKDCVNHTYFAFEIVDDGL
jgi:hypothetical protein